MSVNESEQDDEMLDNYVLSTQLLSDAEPVRCIACHDESDKSLELLTGSQGGVVSRFVLSKTRWDSDSGGEDLVDVQPGGDGSTRHPHQISALVSSWSIEGTSVARLYVTGCKDGKIRVMDGESHEVKFVLEGHSNAVTSLAWIPSPSTAAPWLASGSWDGTAKVWDVFGSRGCCLGTLAGHENTVSVAGLPAAGSSRRLVTVTAGVAEGNVIRGHTVRLWKLTTSSPTSIASQVVHSVANDHSGPMRDVVFDPDTGSIFTCSNDGTVRVRSADDATCHATLASPADAPMLLSLCVVGDAAAKAVVAGAEDGDVFVWDMTHQRDVQRISHPGCVWKVAPLKRGGTDFATACHDGHVRLFTRHASRAASPELLRSFQQTVVDARSSRSSGPSADEISKLPRWEMNSLHHGRSEGQVQVFQKDGKAIAAQWSSASQTWIEVGEVTGTSANAGTLDGKRFDHVLPIELGVPGGGIRTLQIGYNNGDNPFVTAQQFIDEHMLDQNYLAQIADYIRQRAGNSAPTLGMTGNTAVPTHGSTNAAHTTPTTPAHQAVPMETTPIYDHLPMKGYKIFDSGIDKKGLNKVIQKIREFNNIASEQALTAHESGPTLDSLCSTLCITNRYHSSKLTTMELATIHKMILHWGPKHSFPALDLARMAVLHPDASKSERRGYWEEVLEGALKECMGLEDKEKTVAIPMLVMRLVANCYKGGRGSAEAAYSLVNRILECAQACAASNNKNVRLSIATVLLNTASYMHSSTTTNSSAATLLLDVVGTIVGCGKYESEPIVRALVALGTVLILPGCGLEMRKVALERSMGSMVERVVSQGHGDKARAVGEEIKLILSQ